MSEVFVTINIFLSYRRDDSQDISDRICEHLLSHFGPGNVFMDIDAIPLGADFRNYIDEKVSECNVLLAIIGSNWLRILHERQEMSHDFVRVEIESALNRGIPVVPVLVGRAEMPTEQELLEALKPLAFRNATRVGSGKDFKPHIAQLIKDLEALRIPPQKQMTPDELFDELFQHQHLITYWTAYSVLLGKNPEPFHSGRVAEVTKLAATSKRVVFKGHSIGLDSLLVYYESNEPFDEHFEGKDYDLEHWRHIFQDWKT